MAYKTLVASSSAQRRWSYESNASTLGELKEELRAQNIPFEGLSITEGLCTKAELTRDDAIIPVSANTVNYNGETYSRVFLITNTRKNIASGGYDRKALFTKIKEYELGAIIKEIYGKNYTQVSSEQLAITVAEYEKTKNAPAPEEYKLPDIKTAPHPEAVEWYYMGIKAMLKSNLLYPDDIAVIADLTTELYKRMQETSTVITDDDIDFMLTGV